PRGQNGAVETVSSFPPVDSLSAFSHLTDASTCRLIAWSPVTKSRASLARSEDVAGTDVFSIFFSYIQLRPRRVFLRRLHHRFDKGHAADGILDLGIVERGIVLRRLAAFEPGADVVGEILVDVREGFEITLRMRGRRAGGGLRGFAKIAVGG